MKAPNAIAKNKGHIIMTATENVSGSSASTMLKASPISKYIAINTIIDGIFIPPEVRYTLRRRCREKRVLCDIYR